ncbi:MAG: hypothetical protein IT158_25005 [Bryobacterales bacterium]|nr:hypothetical protein [Bryobacterales bacterium]
MNITILVMSLFAALVVLGIILGARQTRQRRAQAKEYALRRGWTYTLSDRALEERLQGLDPENTWTVRDVMHSGGAWLFSATTGARKGRSSPSTSTTCLVERSAPWIAAPVLITRRVPLIDKLLPDRVKDLGGEEFQRGYVAACEDSEVARRAVTPELQRALADHDAGPAWVVTIRLTSGAVVASSSWANTPEEWDYFVRLAQRIAQAL